MLHASGALRLHGRRQPQRASSGIALPGRDGRRRHAHQPAQDLLHPARRRRPGRRAGGGLRGARAATCRCPGRARGATASRLLEYDRPRSHRPGARVLRQLRDAGAGARLHPRARRATGCRRDGRGRGAQRQLHPQGARGATTTCRTTRPSMHEVVFDDRRQASRRREERRHRQAADRLRLPPADDVLPADRPRRAHDRADRERRHRRAGRVHRGDACDRPRGPATTRSWSRARPHDTPVRRLDEVRAARQPVVRWKP